MDRAEDDLLAYRASPPSLHSSPSVFASRALRRYQGRASRTAPRVKIEGQSLFRSDLHDALSAGISRIADGRGVAPRGVV